MTTKKDEKADDPKAGTHGDPDAAPDEQMIPVGKVKLPEGTNINMVPASDGQGGTVMVPADEPGHPDLTTSPPDTTRPEPEPEPAPESAKAKG